MDRLTRMTLVLIRLTWREPILSTSASELSATPTPTEIALVIWSLIAAPLGLMMYLLYCLGIIKKLRKIYKMQLNSKFPYNEEVLTL